MKKIKTILITLILLVGLLSINQIRNVKADSGWDSSYGGGGSSYSSSSHSSSSYSHSSSHSSSSSGSSSPMGSYIGITMTCAIFYLILCMIYNINQLFNIKHPFIILSSIWILATLILGIETMSTVGFITYFIEMLLILSGWIFIPSIPNTNFSKKNYSDISEDELKKYINKSLNEIKEELFNKFVDIQNAWMNFDYDRLQELCNNEIYNTYHEELEALKLKNGQNIMKNFDIVEQKIRGIERNNDKIIITYYLDVKFIDYVINTKTNKVTKGVKKYPLRNQYELKFIVGSKIVENCPNCGGKIKAGTTVCEHCKATIVQDSNSFVMSSKRRVN